MVFRYFAVRGEYLTIPLSGLPGGHPYIAYSLPYPRLWTPAPQDVLRPAAGLRPLHLSHLPDLADRHDGALGIPRRSGTPFASATEIRKSAHTYFLQRLSQGEYIIYNQIIGIMNVIYCFSDFQNQIPFHRTQVRALRRLQHHAGCKASPVSGHR